MSDVGFSAPSGNITCGIQDGSLVCQIEDFTYTPKPAGNCHGGGFWGNDIELNANGTAKFGCQGGVASGGPVLPYGQQITVGAVRCVSQQDAVTCQNTVSGDGFRLARTHYSFFHAPYTGSSKASSQIPSALVGQWQGHGYRVTIAQDGTAKLDYRTYRDCSKGDAKPCDQITSTTIVDGGHIQFTLSTSSNDTSAQGNITRSDDLQYSVGASLTASVKGYNLHLSVWPDTPFCAPNTPAAQWNCGR